MNYQVLARKYRPRRFEEVVGQESVAATLSAAIQQDRLAHAYLFTGPRGVGKTSMARIFAKALNCPQARPDAGDRGGWGEPCNRCPTCEGIALGQDIDVVELDGASHRGIEDIRTIIESVSRPPTRSVYKIFIVDEVHMLTREAFNALLKTLEEPPSHVKFIFATTEAHRIPDTVLSRCQRFDFHPIGEAAIVKRLSQILQEEGREREEGLLERVAKQGKGGLRDAQTLLDQLITFSPGVLSIDALNRMTGRVQEDDVVLLVDSALAGDTKGVFDALRACFGKGADPALLLEQVIDDYRARVHALVQGARPEEEARLDRLIASLQILLEAMGRLKSSPFAHIAVEVVLLKLARLEDPVALDEILREVRRSERSGAGTREPVARASTQGAPLPAAPRFRDSAGPRSGSGTGSPLSGSAPAPGGASASGFGASPSVPVYRSLSLDALESLDSPRPGRGLGPPPPPSLDRPVAPAGRPGHRDETQPPGPRSALAPIGPGGHLARSQGLEGIEGKESPEGAVTTLAAISIEALPQEDEEVGLHGAAPSVPASRQALRAAEAPRDSKASLDAEESPDPVLRSDLETSPDPETSNPIQPGELARLCGVWDQIRVELDARSPEISPFFKDSAPTEVAGSADCFRLEVATDFAFRQMRMVAKQASLLRLVREVTGRPWKIQVQLGTRSLFLAALTEPPSSTPLRDGRRPSPAAADPAGALASPGASPSTGAASPRALPPGEADGSSSPPVSPESRLAGRPGAGISKDPIVLKSLDLFGGRLL